jgi:hypothetical protein
MQTTLSLNLYVVRQIFTKERDTDVMPTEIILLEGSPGTYFLPDFAGLLGL